MKRPERSKVLVLGDRPIAREPFVQRGLTLTPIRIEQLDEVGITNSARGVLLAPYPGKFGLIHSYFEERFDRACDLGLMTAVYVTEMIVQVTEVRDSAYRRLKVGVNIDDAMKRRQWIESLPWVYLGEENWTMAEVLARYDPGPPLGTAFIEQAGEVEALDPQSKILLQRAFHDAERITLKHLAGGRTAKRTFCVFANLSGAEFGPQPMPFFVKLDSAWRIEEEKRNYRELAEPFIPFHLRPALNEVRTVTALNGASLVGNFVESAVSLRDALRTGQGDGAIFSLFEYTLRGLRSHTLKGKKKSGVVESFLTSRVRAHEIALKQPLRIEQLVANGLTRNPEEVEAALKACAAKVKTAEGPYHGDLHYSNIMVRNRDSIVIDFGSMGPFGPLYADPAILEVSLVFGTDDHDDPTSYDEWRNFVDYIYISPLIPPLPKGDYPRFAWLHKAVRELRHVVTCCGVTEKEASIILAGCLLRYGRNSALPLSCNKLDVLAEKRRVYAVMVAYRICEGLEKPNATH